MWLIIVKKIILYINEWINNKLSKSSNKCEWIKPTLNKSILGN